MQSIQNSHYGKTVINKKRQSGRLFSRNSFHMAMQTKVLSYYSPMIFTKKATLVGKDEQFNYTSTLSYSSRGLQTYNDSTTIYFNKLCPHDSNLRYLILILC
jgi:hypothetical protein